MVNRVIELRVIITTNTKSPEIELMNKFQELFEKSQGGLDMVELGINGRFRFSSEFTVEVQRFGGVEARFVLTSDEYNTISQEK